MPSFPGLPLLWGLLCELWGSAHCRLAPGLDAAQLVSHDSNDDALDAKEDEHSLFILAMHARQLIQELLSNSSSPDRQFCSQVKRDCVVKFLI